MTVVTRTERSSDGGNSWQDVDSHTDIGYFQTHSAPGLAVDSEDDLSPLQTARLSRARSAKGSHAVCPSDGSG